VQEIEDELAGVIPRQRRADLEKERTMLLEGRDFAADELEQARTQAELAGLQAVAQRTRLALGRAGRSLAATVRRQRAADGIFSARARALAAREAIAHELAARTLRRVAKRRPRWRRASCARGRQMQGA
jgi:hypothetical protein